MNSLTANILGGFFLKRGANEKIYNNYDCFAVCAGIAGGKNVQAG
jgi:hypothetical protein